MIVDPRARHDPRIMDLCTNVKHAVSLLVLSVCLLWVLYSLREDKQHRRVGPNTLVAENSWRSILYTYGRGNRAVAKGKLIPFNEPICEIISSSNKVLKTLSV